MRNNIYIYILHVQSLAQFDLNRKVFYLHNDISKPPKIKINKHAYPPGASIRPFPTVSAFDPQASHAISVALRPALIWVQGRARTRNSSQNFSYNIKVIKLFKLEFKDETLMQVNIKKTLKRHLLKRLGLRLALTSNNSQFKIEDSCIIEH